MPPPGRGGYAWPAAGGWPPVNAMFTELSCAAPNDRVESGVEEINEPTFQAGRNALDRVFLDHCRRMLLQRAGAATGRWRAPGSVEHEAGRDERPAGAKRLSADHSSPGRAL